MTIYQNITQFAGKKVVEYQKDSSFDPETQTIRVSVGYDEAEDGITLLSLITALSKNSQASGITHLIIGTWEEAFENTPEETVSFLTENAELFPALSCVFFGEMTSEENEMSWIYQVDYQNFLKSYPKLEHFQARGGNDLKLSELKSEYLKTLIIETGGMDQYLLQNIIDSELPNLEYLELWFGEDSYGWNGSVVQIEKIVEKYGNQVSYLGLKNSEIEDDIATYLSENSDTWKSVRILDLSMGNLSDKGAEKLLNCPNVSSLEYLNLEHHYLSDEMMTKFKNLNIKVNLDEQEKVDEYDGEEYRYISVGE